MNNLLYDFFVLFILLVGFIVFLGWINKKRQKELREKLKFKVVF